jgi:RNA polymerase sigma-70 factor (ECF subfamily)
MAKAPARRGALGPQGAAALAAAYDTWAPQLFATARRLIGDTADAEECVQEVFVKFAERRGGLASVDDLGAYLFTSLRHRAAARSRQGQRQSALHLRAAPAAEPAATHPDRGDARGLERALQRLPLEQREVLALKIDGELTFAEIAVLLGVSPNTAASRYRYALARLKAALEEDGP